MRAGLLSNPAFVNELNAHAVTVVVDKNTERDISKLEGEFFTRRERVGMHLLTPEGRYIDSITQFNDELGPSLAALKRIAQANGIEARAPVVTYTPQAPAHEADDLVLTQTARFLKRRPGDRPPSNPPFFVPLNEKAPVDPMESYLLHLTSSTREFLVLPASEWRSLAPPAGESIGTRWTVDSQVAADLLWRVRPPTHYSHLRKSDVESAALRCELVAPNQVRLTGHVQVRQRWFPRAEEGLWLGTLNRNGHRAISDVVGYATWNPALGRFDALTIVTDNGEYRGEDGSVLPFATAITKVDDSQLGMSR